MSLAKVKKTFGAVSSPRIEFDKSAVAQATSITTSVPVMTQAGVITTVSSTLAAGATTTFDVTNPYVRAESVVLVTLSGYTGAGVPIVSSGSPSGGSFSIHIRNIHDSAALDNTIKISYVILY
jgi:hypothetical protein